MSDFVEGKFLDRRHTELLLGVYEAACQVATKYPEGHAAGIAARKIIAAFDSECCAIETCRRPVPAMMGSA
jgi:hypothetical protein